MSRAATIRILPEALEVPDLGGARPWRCQTLEVIEEMRAQVCERGEDDRAARS